MKIQQKLLWAPPAPTEKVVSPVQSTGPRATCARAEGIAAEKTGESGLKPRRWADLTPAEKEELKDWGEFLKALTPRRNR